ncbi:MAG: PD-(D/E)XK nuclease family protein, partial [Bacteroidia bacterium]|nr:PD-(D/E)XK nuclease family protein [Bacteroidia bacterium]
KRTNISFVSLSWLKKFGGEKFDAMSFLFEKWQDGKTALSSLERANEIFKSYYFSKINPSVIQKIELEFIISFSAVLNRLNDLVNENPAVNDLQSVFQLLKQVVAEKTVPFFGEPLAGLQLMGVLETRTLDFENIVVLGMNEGILPAGKGGNSFIPYDLKKYFGLPLGKDKDAVYAYHFYRLLQRTKNVCLVYNTESDTFGSGEKSRFLTQIEMELPVKNPNVSITKKILGGVLPKHSSHEISISKDESSLLKLEKKCDPAENRSGLSPSSLNLFKECSLKFYFKYIASVKEEDEVEEDMEAGTFGSILHGTLENLYKPFEEKILKKENLGFGEKEIQKEILKVYNEIYQEEGFLKGKNLLAVSIIEVYVKKMLSEDAKLIATLSEKKENLQIIALEKELFAEIIITANGKNIPVKISGKCDRMDRVGEFFRIVDYKSSVKDTDKFLFENFEDLFTGKGNNKMIQLFIYAWLVWKQKLAAPHQLVPCIIPFKHYSGKPNRVLTKDKQDLLFSEELLNGFEEQLKKFVASMFNAKANFYQTEDVKICEWCDYNVICNR